MRVWLDKVLTVLLVAASVVLVIGGLVAYGWTVLTSHDEFSSLVMYPVYMGAIILISLVAQPAKKTAARRSRKASGVLTDK